MNDWDQRNALVERLTDRMRRKEATPAEVEILLVICRPVWMATIRGLWRYGGVEVDSRADGVHRREEAKRVAELDRDHLSQVVQEALLDALGHCPRPFPSRFFRWLKVVLAHRALDYIRGDLTEHTTLMPEDRGIADLLDAVFADEQTANASYRSMGSPAYHQWVRTLDLARLFEISAEYATYARTRSACERAVERLPPRQRQVIQKHYFEAMTHEQIAGERQVAASTVRNTHAGALRNLQRDDELFDVLEAVGKVRDYARRRHREQLRVAA
jgi:RNA polymerase sigma factor (sigma-70 family)